MGKKNYRRRRNCNPLEELVEWLKINVIGFWLPITVIGLGLFRIWKTP